MLAWGSEWCKVQSMDGKYTGYAKNKWLFHYHSLNRFRWDVPGYETYRLNGYVVMTGEQHITDSKDLYGAIPCTWEIHLCQGRPRRRWKPCCAGICVH